MCPGGKGNVPQSSPLAIIPYGAINCTLDQFETEAAATGVPDRLSYSVIGQTELGRDIFGVVVNALDTPEQQAAFDRWEQLRAIMLTDPEAAQDLLATWRANGENVKLPIFVEANIHGGEREGTDAMMQVIRDLVTLPHGTNDVVDDLLDNAVVVVIPTTNPDGRVAGRRTNENRFDLNRDLLVQSQPESAPTRPSSSSGWPRSGCSCMGTGRTRRRADEAAQPRAGVRQVPVLEPAPAGRQRGGHRGDRSDHPASGQSVGRARHQRTKNGGPEVAEAGTTGARSTARRTARSSA